MWSEGAGDAGKDDNILLLKFNFSNRRITIA